MKLLITGICGFVGTTLALALKDSIPNCELFGIDNLLRPGSWLNRDRLSDAGIKVIYGDIRQGSDVESLPRADWVIDAAANPSVLAGIDGKTNSLQLVENNLVGTVRLLEYCRKHKSGFILLSTSRIYSIEPLTTLQMEVVDGAFTPKVSQIFPMGLSLNGVSEEFASTPPISLYGATKLASEQMALEYGLTFDFPVWINRCGVMAGPGQFGHPGQGIFAYWIHSFREKQPLKYIGFGGSGYQVRDCLHPRDLLPVLLKQFDEPLATGRPRISNFSGGVHNACSLWQLSRWAEKRFGKTDIFSSGEERKFDIPWMVLDPAQAMRVWDWMPERDLFSICDDIADFAEKHEKWCQMSAS